MTAAKSRKIYFFIGVALTKRRAKRLFDKGLDTANISLDTLEPMKAEFITRRPTTFHKVSLIMSIFLFILI